MCASMLSRRGGCDASRTHPGGGRSEEHTSELQSRSDLVCRLLLEKKKKERHRNVIQETEPAVDHERRQPVQRVWSHKHVDHKHLTDRCAEHTRHISASGAACLTQ